MFNKIDSKLSNVLVVGCLVMSALCFARAQYYQGRIDARREIQDELVDILIDTFKMRQDKKEEV